MTGEQLEQLVIVSGDLQRRATRVQENQERVSKISEQTEVCRYLTGLYPKTVPSRDVV